MIPHVQVIIIYSLCRKSSIMWIYGNTWHRQTISWKSIHYNLLTHINTLLMSSFLRIYQLCHQGTLNFFLMTTCSNRTIVYIFLDAQISIENTLALLSSLLCVLFGSLHNILKNIFSSFYIWWIRPLNLWECQHIFAVQAKWKNNNNYFKCPLSHKTSKREWNLKQRNSFLGT